MCCVRICIMCVCVCVCVCVRVRACHMYSAFDYGVYRKFGFYIHMYIHIETTFLYVFIYIFLCYRCLEEYCRLVSLHYSITLLVVTHIRTCTSSPVAGLVLLL